jgi:ABC-type sugar transport system permease subunit
MVALGLIATASRVGTAFYAFGLVLLPTLTFVGLVTFERTLQSGMEDLGYARRIALLRGYYFDQAPELAPFLMSVPGPERLRVLGLGEGRWQAFRSVAAMVAVITAVLAGSAIGLLAAVVTEHSVASALVAGGVIALVALGATMRRQQAAWVHATSEPVSFEQDDTTIAPG